MHNNKLTVFIFEMAPFREGSSQPNFIDKEVNNIKMFSLKSWAMVNLKIGLRIHYIDSIQKGAIPIWNFENQSNNAWFLFYIKTSPNRCTSPFNTNLKKIGRIETNENFEIFLQLVPIWVGGLLRKSCVCWTRYRLQEYISDCSVSKATRLVPCKCEHSYMNKAYLILYNTIMYTYSICINREQKIRGKKWWETERKKQIEENKWINDN